MATGKISRLPREIREQVNRQLDDGVPGKRLVAWLNEQPEVKALLAAEFGGTAINEQNLTNWKQGGFQEWRIEQEVAAFNRAVAGTEVPVVTTEQLTTVMAVRYLVTVREWQQSPVPSERRWRRLRVMLRDAVKLQRNEQREQRLELGEKRLEFDREKLQFAKEQFEAGKQSDVRRVMTAFLVAAKQWPEVQEALAGAFRLLQERKGAKTEGKQAGLEPIKVNEGEINKKVEEAQTESAGRSPTSLTNESVLVRHDGARGGTSVRPPSRTGIRPTCASVGNSSHTTSTAVGLRTEGNGAESGSIKVNQGKSNHFFYPERARPGTIRRRCATAQRGMGERMRKIKFHGSFIPWARGSPGAPANISQPVWA